MSKEILFLLVMELLMTTAEICQHVDTCPTDDDVTVIRKSTPLRRHLEQSCFCDRICPIMRDCCSDRNDVTGIDDIRNNLKQWSSLIGIESHLHCSPIQSVSGIKYVSDQLHKTYLKDIFMVSSCPEDYDNVVIIQKCMDKSPVNDKFQEGGDHFNEWPVTSNVSGIWYRNLFCAACWQDHDVIFWQAVTQCAKDDEPSLGADFLAFDTETDADTESSTCNEDGYMFLSPTGFHNLRSCVEPGVVTACSRSWADESVRRQCEETVNGPLVYDNASIPYSNLHCYKCNYGNMANVRCERNLTNYIEHNYDDFLSGMFPITVLFDPRASAARNKVSATRCPWDAVYDAFSKSCKQIFCPNSNELLDEGPCPHTTLYNCTRITLNVDEYDLSGDNATLYNYGVVLTREKYIITENLTLIACRKFLFEREEVRTEPVDIATLVSVISQLISIVCLLLSLIIYALLPKLRNTPGKTLMSLMTSILLAQTIFLTGAGRTERREVCFTIAVVIHYCTLAAFFWMNTLAVDLALTFKPNMRQRSRKSVKRKFLYFSLYGWLGPLVVILVSLLLELFHDQTAPFNPSYVGNKICWLSNIEGLVVFFLLPIAFLLSINVILYIITTVNIIKAARVGARARDNRTTNLAIYIKLSFIMGIAWIFAFLWMLTRNDVIRYIFIVANGLQGLFLFISFVCRRRVYHQFLVRIGRRQELYDSKKSNSTTSNYNTNRIVTDETRISGIKVTM